MSLPSTAASTISAAPQLRNFKAEVVAFVPNVVKRKKVAVIAGGTVATINATPSISAPVDDEGSDVVQKEERPSLMGALKGAGVFDHKAAAGQKSKGQGAEDYDRFLTEMDGLL